MYVWSTEAAQVVFQSLAATYLLLGLYRIAEWQAPWMALARRGILQIVARGLGAALANRMLAVDGDGTERKPLTRPPNSSSSTCLPTASVGVSSSARRTPSPCARRSPPGPRCDSEALK